jgi:hypothetical protein
VLEFVLLFSEAGITIKHPVAISIAQVTHPRAFDLLLFEGMITAVGIKLGSLTKRRAATSIVLLMIIGMALLGLASAHLESHDLIPKYPLPVAGVFTLIAEILKKLALRLN